MIEMLGEKNKAIMAFFSILLLTKEKVTLSIHEQKNLEKRLEAAERLNGFLE